MFPSALWADDMCGGLAGGDAKRAACRRVSGGVCDESHEKADGSSIFAEETKVLFLVKVAAFFFLVSFSQWI